jgi:Yip1 domain
MNPAMRAKAMLADPFTEWTRIERESGDPVYLVSRYVAILALVPVIFGFLGSSIVGEVVPGAGVVKANAFDGLFGAIFTYVATFIIVFVLALIINFLAPYFSGQRDFDAALKLTVYSFTPVWLAGVFLILPGFRFLVLTGFYGVYVLWTGLPRLMKTPPARSRSYVLIIAACGFALILAAIIGQRVVFGTRGI